MGKEVKFTTDRPARITTWTVMGNAKETDVPETVEKYDEIGISIFDFPDKEVTCRLGGKYGHITFLRLLIHL